MLHQANACPLTVAKTRSTGANSSGAVWSSNPTSIDAHVVHWSGFRDLHQTVIEDVQEAIRRVTGREGTVTCRFTHIYPNGPAPYLTFHCLPERTRMTQQCMEIKVAAYDAILPESAARP